MKKSIIAAIAQNRVIGLANQLPWRLPADMKRFKQLTMGHTLLMGRKTYESIGRPLPGRTMLVITRARDTAPEGVIVVHSFEEALARASGDELFICGGADIYRQALPLADRLYLTYIEKAFEGDAYFPQFDVNEWELCELERHDGGELPYRFETYDRRRG
jgi:dihydrofolate reductase